MQLAIAIVAFLESELNVSSNKLSKTAVSRCHKKQTSDRKAIATSREVENHDEPKMKLPEPVIIPIENPIDSGLVGTTEIFPVPVSQSIIEFSSRVEMAAKTSELIATDSRQNQKRKGIYSVWVLILSSFKC